MVKFCIQWDPREYSANVKIVATAYKLVLWQPLVNGELHEQFHSQKQIRNILAYSLLCCHFPRPLCIRPVISSNFMVGQEEDQPQFYP